MLRSSSLWISLSVVLMFAGIWLLFSAGNADAQAEQEALDDSHCGMAEVLDLPTGSDCIEEEEEGSTTGKWVAGWGSLGGGVLAGAVGGLLVWRPDALGANPSSLGGDTPRPAETESQQETDEVSLVSSTMTHPSSGIAQDVVRRICPECGEKIAATARLCRFCFSAVEPEQPR